MLTVIIKKFPILLVPATILIATWFLVPQLALLTSPRQELVTLAPYIVFLPGMFLAVHFHRARPFMSLLLLLLFYWCSRTFLTGEQIEPALNKMYQAFVLMVPLNLLLFTILRERGLFSTAGRTRFVVLAVQAAGVLWLFRYHFEDLLPYIAGSYTRMPLFSGLLIPQPAFISACLCLAVIAVLTLQRQSPVDSGMLGALAAFLIACNWVTNRDMHAAFSAAGGVIITLSVLRDSYNMAFRDDLTGIPSRRSLNESLHGLGRTYAVAMLDVDHFKRFNDTYGHDVGDQVLKMVAQKMTDVGGGGKVFRYGGEEFTILFTGRRADEALPHLEELRSTIAAYRMAVRNDERPKNQQLGKEKRGSRAGRAAETYASVTVSIGVAESGNGLNSAAEVLKAADRALYKAKNRGRNQVCR